MKKIVSTVEAKGGNIHDKKKLYGVYFVEFSPMLLSVIHKENQKRELKLNLNYYKSPNE